VKKTPERKPAIRIVAAPIGANEARSVKSERATSYRGTNSEATAKHRRHSRSGAHRGEEYSGWEVRREDTLGRVRTASGSLDDARGMTRRNHGTHSWSCTASQFADGGTGLREVPSAWERRMSFRCGSPGLTRCLPRCQMRARNAVSAITKITATVRSVRPRYSAPFGETRPRQRLPSMGQPSDDWFLSNRPRWDAVAAALDPPPRGLPRDEVASRGHGCSSDQDGRAAGNPVFSAIRCNYTWLHTLHLIWAFNEIFWEQGKDWEKV